MDKGLSSTLVTEEGGETEEVLLKLAAIAPCVCRFIFRNEKCFVSPSHSYHSSVNITHIFQKRAPSKEKNTESIPPLFIHLISWQLGVL